MAVLVTMGLSADILLWLLLSALAAAVVSVLVTLSFHRRQQARWHTDQQSLQEQLQQQQQQYSQLRDVEAQARVDLAAQRERLVTMDRVEEELFQREEDLDSLRQQYNTLMAEAKSRDTEMRLQQQNHEEKLAVLEQARQQLQLEFKQLAQQIFSEQGRQFGQQQQEKLQGILQPVRQQLDDFKKQVTDVYDKEAKDRRGLYEQIENLKQLNQQMSEDAVNLTRALKSESKTQGNWGELVLARLLEQSGLRQGREYELQVHSRDDAGKRYQPDVVIYLPDNKQIILDAKVSLRDFERYSSAEDEPTKRSAIKTHIASIKRHIDQLSAKGYEQLPDFESLDCVLMFVPIDGALLQALDEDASLFSYGFERNVLLVSPATLLVTLRTVNLIWRTEKQNLHALEIARQAGDLYDKFVGFTDALDDVGRHLQQAANAYESAHKRLVSGKGNLVNRADELRQLGARTKKNLADKLLAEADLEIVEFTDNKNR